MAMSAGPGRGGLKSDINITPLVDVVLVLLIIFMVVTPMMQKGREVRLPNASNVSSPPPKEKPLVLSITEEHALYVERDRVPDRAHFKSRLEQELRLEPSRRVLLKADQALTCGDVQEVMGLVRASGARSVGLSVEKLQAP